MLRAYCTMMEQHGPKTQDSSAPTPTPQANPPKQETHHTEERAPKTNDAGDEGRTSPLVQVSGSIFLNLFEWKLNCIHTQLKDHNR